VLLAPTWAVVALVAAILGAALTLVFAVRARDLTRRLARAAAREAALKARHDHVFEHTSDIVALHDRKARIAALNRAGERIIGYTRDELRVLDPTWIFTDDYLDVIHEMLHDGADAAPRAFHAQLMARQGGRLPVDVQARVLLQDGEFTGIAVIAQDQSERTRLENEVRQAQKMEAVGKLATGIAHDFNNLITVLLGYSDELVDDLPKDSQWRQSALEIRQAAERASALTQQLLAFSRRQTTMPQALELNASILAMEDLMRRLLGVDIKLDFQLAPDLADIYADPAQIGQVVMNLAVNARDAMPTGGTLTIETANVELGPENVNVIPGPHVLLAMRDTGAGMSPEVQKRLFEPFFTTKGAGQGTGLGLSMVQSIVRQSGGHISVESREGQGSTFRVYFPRMKDGVARPPVVEADAAPAVHGSGVVLLAEDDRAVRRLVSGELARRGFSVLEAQDGRDAIDVCHSHKGPIDVLVTDVVMPRMNGAELAARVAEIRPGVKVLFISGHPERAGTGLDPTGHTNLLMKPFTADTLAGRITDLINS
jgi:PAS domain S-box-containing protein